VVVKMNAGKIDWLGMLLTGGMSVLVSYLVSRGGTTGWVLLIMFATIAAPVFGFCGMVFFTALGLGCGVFHPALSLMSWAGCGFFTWMVLVGMGAASMEG
jgi:hypothetical protein